MSKSLSRGSRGEGRREGGKRGLGDSTRGWGRRCRSSNHSPNAPGVRSANTCSETSPRAAAAFDRWGAKRPERKDETAAARACSDSLASTPLLLLLHTDEACS